jgi:GNAT superfamily N-acetyltransferase
MKGQKLFVRPADPADENALRAFYASEECEAPAELAVSPGLVGKLVGEIVAHVVTSREADRVVIRHIYVTKHLRVKRIGRVMITAALAAAAREGALAVAADVACQAAPFFLRMEFAVENGWLVKALR